MIPLIEQYLEELVAFKGIRGCSLVECESGLVLHSAGEFEDVEPLSEAAVEFWRLHGRLQDNLQALGSLNLAMLSFQKGWLALTSCPGDASRMVVAVTQSQAVDWPGWLSHARNAGPFSRAPGS